MVIIIKEQIDNKHFMTVDTDDINALQLTAIRNDAQNGTNLTGWADYRLIAEHHKLINSADLLSWRTKLPSVIEKPIFTPTTIVP